MRTMRWKAQFWKAGLAFHLEHRLSLGHTRKDQPFQIPQLLLPALELVPYIPQWPDCRQQQRRLRASSLNPLADTRLDSLVPMRKPQLIMPRRHKEERHLFARRKVAAITRRKHKVLRSDQLTTDLCAPVDEMANETVAAHSSVTKEKGETRSIATEGWIPSADQTATTFKSKALLAIVGVILQSLHPWHHRNAK